MEGFSYFPINVCVGMRFLYYQGPHLDYKDTLSRCGCRI